jgi:hypothetical protein
MILRETTLRLPAALVVASLSAVLVLGEIVFWTPDVRTFVILSTCGLPFVLPWFWASTRTRATALFAWVSCAAILVTARLGYLAIWFFSRRPLGIWVPLTVAFIAVTIAFWMTVWAAWRRVPRG